MSNSIPNKIRQLWQFFLQTQKKPNQSALFRNLVLNREELENINAIDKKNYSC